MTIQREIWRQEYRKPQIFVRLHSDNPSGPIPGFVDFLKNELKPEQSRILDIGCGKGRNSIYLADQGFNVLGIDFAPEAVVEAKARAKGKKHLEFKEMDLSETWPFNNEFDAIVDCNTSICIPNPGREEMVDLAYRALKTGGYYLFYGVAPTEFLKKNPGPEPNSGFFSRTGKFEKQYSKTELLETYKNFKLIKLDEISGSDFIEGELITYSMWVVVFQK